VCIKDGATALLCKQPFLPSAVRHRMPSHWLPGTHTSTQCHHLICCLCFGAQIEIDGQGYVVTSLVLKYKVRGVL
jgi:hypothetical protein